MSYLPINDFVGHDNKIYRDLAVESTQDNTVLAWVRRRLVDGKYFLVTAVVGGHVLRKEIEQEEAIVIYHAMSSKISYADAFCSAAKLKKANDSARKAAKSKPQPAE